ncbi:MAG: tRNA-dihydrouridine synthase family protein [Candidatus Saccharimonas sp.]|nr:tRNA-dihydrouridine synthase family protein [Candidatus Saccharimonas sp.]
MKSFWQQLPRPFFVLAPMEAVTDVVFRHVIERAGRPDVYFTEFTNATGWFRAGNKAIGGRLVKTTDESPIVAQLWGSEPEAMAALSQHCAELGYDGIDINMGCPDQSAIKGGGGAGMIRAPGLAYEIIAAAKTSGLPVSVKTRLGYTYVNEWRDWLGGLLRQNITVLTIHLRTKKEMSKVPAHFELIPEIKALRDEIAPETLLVINGDVRDRAHGLEFVEKYGVDGVMIGRGVFANPFCFRDEQERVVENPSNKKSDLIQLLCYHLDQFDLYQPQMGRPFETLKRFFKIYIRDFDGASTLRDKMMHCNSTDDVRSVLDNI